jgi:pteridine reductase
VTGTPRVTLVTGGARRVGAAIVRAAAARGDHVFIHAATSVETAEALALTLREAGARADVVRGDLRDDAVPRRLIDDVIAGGGRLDLLVNSAASFVRAAPLELTPAQWDEAFSVNVRAPFFLAQAAARVMAPGSAIINLVDHLAFETMPAMLAHAAAKDALVHVTRTLARALAPAIRVNAVAPGLVAPPEGWGQEEIARFLRGVPLGRVGSPEDVAAAVLWLAEAEYVTGAVVQVDGGRGAVR